MYVPPLALYWEQKVLSFALTPFQVVGAIIYLVLSPVYVVLGMMRLPLVLLTLLMSVIWLPVVGVVMGCAALSRSTRFVRPISFVIAFPFLLIGTLLVSVEPVMSPGDAEGKAAKMFFLESFPESSLAGGAG